MYLRNRLYDAAKLHHHQSLLVAQPEEAPQDSSWHEDIWSILKQIHFTKLHKVYQSVCCQPKITIIETQRKRRESCMSLDLDSHFINSHGLWWTLKKSALCQGMGMPLWKRFGIHTSAQGSQGNVRKQSRKMQETTFAEPNSQVNHSTLAAVICCDI